MEIGEAIRRARDAEKVTQGQMAAVIASNGDAETVVTQGVISRWESGERTPTIADVAAVENALRLPRGRLFIVAGLVSEVASVSQAIAADTDLTDQSRDALLAAYRAFRDVSRRAPG